MKSLVILVLLAASGCAAHKSYNKTATGKVYLTGGVYHEESWDENLKLNFPLRIPEAAFPAPFWVGEHGERGFRVCGI